MGLVLPQIVKVKWNSKIKKHYVNKGYVFTKMKDEFEVDVRDLTKGSKVKVKCVCDVCGDITYKTNNMLTKELKTNGKLYCSKCKYIKIKQIWKEKSPFQLKEIQKKKKQTLKENYGVENPLQSKEIQEKIKQTCLNKFGVENPLQSKEIQEKRKQTLKENYGVEIPLQSKKIQEKRKQTCLNNFGVESPFQSKEIQEKIKQTLKENYGVENPSQSKEIQEKRKQTCLNNFGVESPLQSKEIQGKAMKTKIDRYGSNFGEKMIKGSSQQKHIHELIGGEYNYPFHGFFPDIALLDKKIVIEYDGTGHDISVKCGKITKEEFIQKEQDKENKLFEHGWKLIRLVNEKNDNLPDDITLVDTINEKIHILKTTDTKKVVVKWS